MDIRMSAIKHWDVLDCYLLLSDWIGRQAQDKCCRLTKYSMTVSYYRPSTKRLACLLPSYPTPLQVTLTTVLKKGPCHDNKPRDRPKEPYKQHSLPTEKESPQYPLVPTEIPLKKRLTRIPIRRHQHNSLPNPPPDKIPAVHQNPTNIRILKKCPAPSTSSCQLNNLAPPLSHGA